MARVRASSSKSIVVSTSLPYDLGAIFADLSKFGLKVYFALACFYCSNFSSRFRRLYISSSLVLSPSRMSRSRRPSFFEAEDESAR